MAQITALPPGPQDWRRRFTEALRLLGTDVAGANALERADALWLARLLPVPATPAGAPGKLPTAGAGAHAGGTPAAKKSSSADRHHGADRTERDGTPQQFGASTSLFVAQPGKEGEEQLSARRVQVPVADALPGRAAIERALKPFLRKRPSANRRVVDTQATAEASAQACAELLAGAPPGTRAYALVPVLRPVAERWFDVVLLAERDEAMLAFEDTLIELRNLLARHGAFGQVRLWRWSVKAGVVHVESPSGMACAPRAMLQSQRPLLALVLTHGASAQWEGTVLRKFVRDLGARSVLAIVQMLPAKAWGFTALGEAPELVRARERGSVNRLLQRLDVWRGGFRDRGGLDAVPMLSLDAPALEAWADFVMSPRLLQHAAVSLEDDVASVLPPGVPAAGAATAPAGTPEAARERVLRFRAIASAQAFALLRLLAGTWITLPVMRLLLHSLPGPRSLAPAAEVLLSGLLVRVSPPGGAAQDMVFDFVPGLREWLHGSLSGEEQRQASSAMAESREAIRRFVEAKSGVKLASFSALLRDPRGTEFLPASARSFLELSRRLRALRGGGASMPGVERGGMHVQGAAAELGVLRNFPPLMEGLVPRPALEDRLAERVLALASGGVLRLRAMPGAGVRTLLGNVLRRHSVRSRFGGGIWFDTDPPAEPAAAHLQRLVVRFGAKGRVGGDTSIDVRMQRQGDIDVGHLDAAEAQAHLEQMGLQGTEATDLWSVHQGVPSLVPIVGAGWLRGIRRWPRRDTERPESNYGALSLKVLRQLTAAERDGLIVMSARRPGYPDRKTGSEALAVQLAWQCRTPDGTAATLHPAVSQFLQSAYREEVRGAHEVILGELTLGTPTPLLPPTYLRDHLLHHAIAARGAEGARRVLFDRHLLVQILHGDRSGMLRALAPLARKDRQLARVADELQSGAPIEVLADHAREGLAPVPNWPAWLGLPELRLRETFGAGVRVAIISTGVDATHPELQHLAIDGARTDPQGHGTAVASVVAGRFVGIAPMVRLQSYAALDAQGHGATSTVLTAIDAMLSVPPDERPDILCLPLGMGSSDGAIAHALRLVAAQDILVVAAAGNEGSQEPVQFPASMPEVLGVGALEQDGRPLGFSNRGSATWEGQLQKEGPDLWAPGANALAAVAAGTRGGSGGPVLPPARYTTMSGTSFSCAAVVGLAARYMEVTGLRGAALRGLLLAHATEEGRVRYVPDLGEAAESVPEALPSSARQLESAVPGDVVSIETSDGATLILHPANAAELFRREGNADAQRSGGLAQPSPLLSRIQVLGGVAKDPSTTLAEAQHQLDAQVDAGLYALRPDSLAALKGSPTADSLAWEFPGGVPILVLVHGVFLSTASTFGALWTAHHETRHDLFRAYRDRVYALDHPTLGVSPVAAALTLARALPSTAPVHLATHSSGGLVAEVLARVAGQPEEIERVVSTFFSADADAADRRALLELASVIREKHISIDRVVRVACPAKGIRIEEERLDIWLSLFRNALRLGHIPAQPAFEAFLVEAVRSRTWPSRVPGIACLLPEAPLIRWLNSPVEPLPGDLRVIAGNTRGFGNAAWVEVLGTRGASWAESDLVVQTVSMYAGARRRGGSSSWLAEGLDATHFSYFGGATSARAFVDALVLDHPTLFQPFEPS